jgi:hypothetical protein
MYYSLNVNRLIIYGAGQSVTEIIFGNAGNTGRFPPAGSCARAAAKATRHPRLNRPAAIGNGPGRFHFGAAAFSSSSSRR